MTKGGRRPSAGRKPTGQGRDAGARQPRSARRDRARAARRNGTSLLAQAEAIFVDVPGTRWRRPTN